MSTDATDRLYDLLPAIYRIRDAEQGEPLRALLAVAEGELATVEADIARLYENWFIETCDEWVIPYIGDLVGNRPLYPVARARRTDVAKTISYRRRKGTLAMLEEMARDVTGWSAHAVAFFELLGWTQNLDHLRFTPAPDSGRGDPFSVTRVGTVNLRATGALGRLGTAFDEVAHGVDVRPIARTEGWYDLRNVGIFLWRLQSYPLRDIAPRRAAPPHNGYGYHFSQFGCPAPLFIEPDREADPTGMATEVQVRAPLRREALVADLRAYRDRYAALPPDQRPPASTFYGPGRSFDIRRDGQPVSPLDLVVGDLAQWCRPPAGRVGVDVERGRLVFAEGEEPREVSVDFSYGFSADIGGGPYDRRATLLDPDAAGWRVRVRKGTAVRSVQQAVQLWEQAGRPRGVVQIDDSGVYGGRIRIELPDDGRLVIQAANGVSPDLRLIGNLELVAPPAGGTVELDGLQMEGGIRAEGPLTLRMRHCTIVPGRMLNDDCAPVSADRDSLVVSAAAPGRPEVTLQSCVVGPIRLPSFAGPLVIEDSIVQALPVGGVERPAIAATDPGDVPGPPTVLRRCTIFGAVYVPELALASEVIFTAPVRVQRRQSGCVRFSSVPEGSRTPRRYRCQPDLALDGVADPGEQERVRARLAPAFTSTSFGLPGYAQLHWSCAVEIRAGAEDGSEMGVFCRLQQPQREANLRTRLEEYLPFGLDAGLLYLT